MSEYQLTESNILSVFESLQDELKETPVLLVETKNANIGKWGMSKLWRAWMAETAKFMASKGCVMPLMIDQHGKHYGERPFNADDAHELFSCKWLGVDKDGKRLSWSRSGHDDMRPATKGERFQAMQRHEAWATEKGIILFKPRDSELCEIEKEAGE
jgi:hypothetical protein